MIKIRSAHRLVFYLLAWMLVVRAEAAAPSFHLVPAGVSLHSGETMVVGLDIDTASAATRGGIIAIQFDPAVLMIDTSSGITTTTQATFALGPPASVDGNILHIAFYQKDWNMAAYQGRLASFKIKAIAPTTSTSLIFSPSGTQFSPALDNTTLAGAELQVLPPVLQPKIQVLPSSATLTVGDNVTIGVSVDTAKSVVRGGSVAVEYNPLDFELIGGSTGIHRSPNSPFDLSPPPSTSSGRIEIALYNPATNPVAYKGTVTTFTLHALRINSASAISLDSEVSRFSPDLASTLRTSAQFKINPPPNGPFFSIWPTSGTLTKGERVDLTLGINTGGQAVLGGIATVEFDPGVLSIDSTNTLIAVDPTSPFVFQPAPQLNSGKLEIAFVQNQFKSDIYKGPLGKIPFKALHTTNATPVSFNAESTRFSPDLAGTIRTSGIFKIVSSTAQPVIRLTPATASIHAGDTTTVTLNVDTGGQGTRGMAATILFDASVFELVGGVDGVQNAAGSPFLLNPKPSYTSGHLELALSTMDLSLKSYSGIVAKFSLRALKSAVAQQVRLDPSLTRFSPDLDDTQLFGAVYDVAIAPSAPIISIAPALNHLTAGDQIRVAINLNTSSHSVLGGTAVLVFNPALLEIVGGTGGVTKAPGSPFELSPPPILSPGNLQIPFLGSYFQSVNYHGDIVQISFRALAACSMTTIALAQDLTRLSPDPGEIFLAGAALDIKTSSTATRPSIAIRPAIGSLTLNHSMEISLDVDLTTQTARGASAVILYDSTVLAIDKVTKANGSPFDLSPMPSWGNGRIEIAMVQPEFRQINFCGSVAKITLRGINECTSTTLGYNPSFTRYSPDLPNTMLQTASYEVYSTGTLGIHIIPSIAVWDLAGPKGYSAQGQGSSTLKGLKTGSYTIQWHTLSGWVAPIAQTLTLSRDQWTTFSTQYTRQTGTVIVNPKPSMAKWWLTDGDGVVHAGNGLQTFNNIPTGPITLNWDQLVGYDPPTPNPNTQILTFGATVTFNGNYTRQTGTLGIKVTPRWAEWNLTGPLAVNNSGTTTILHAPVGLYSLTWKALTGWTMPSPGTINLTLSKDQITSFTGIYTRQKGTVTVDVTPNSATWSIKDGDGQIHSAAGDKTILNVPTGQVVMTWGQLTNYDTPPTGIKTLVHDQMIAFMEIYVPVTDPFERRNAQIIRYLLGLTNDSTGMDTNIDGKVDISDLVKNNNLNPPTIPAAPNPKDGATTISVITNLDWADCLRAKSYNVYVWKNSDKKPTTATATGLKTSYYDPPTTLTYNTTYKWQVVAVNGSLQTAGPEWTFSTKPQVVHLVSPNGGNIWAKGTKVQIHWIANRKTAGTAVRFELWRNGAKIKEIGSGYSDLGENTNVVTIPSISTCLSM